MPEPFACRRKPMYKALATRLVDQYMSIQVPSIMYSPANQHISHQMPHHWRLDLTSALLRFLLKFLCVVLFGDADLNRCWEIANAEESIWKEKKVTSDGLATITVIAGLLLGSEAAFAATVPPISQLFDYNQDAPYVCLLVAFGLTLGGLIVGSTVLFVLSKCDANWFINTLVSSRLKVCCTLVIMRYPFFAIGVSTLVLTFGLLVCAWTSSNRIIRIGVVFMLIFPVALSLVFGWT